MISDLLKHNIGQIVVSVILGLGLAALFRKACNDNNCLIIKSPPSNEINDKVFKSNNKCYTYTPETTSCPVKEES